jgi:hypothetical protein
MIRATLPVDPLQSASAEGEGPPPLYTATKNLSSMDLNAAESSQPRTGSMGLDIRYAVTQIQFNNCFLTKPQARRCGDSSDGNNRQWEKHIHFPLCRGCSSWPHP